MFIGFVNGWFVTKLNIPSFLVTLGMLLVVRGTALYITDGFPQRTWNAEDQWLAQVLVGDFYVGPFRIYMSVFWFVLAAVLAHYLLNGTKAGNWIQASGGNAGRGTGPRRQCQPHQDSAVHAVVGDGGIRRHHFLDPHLRRQSQQRHRL